MQHITKTLIIGLGGTGNLALKYAKKRFYETYSDYVRTNDGKKKTFNQFFDPGDKALPMVDFLALDTDPGDLKQGINDNNEPVADGKYKLDKSDYYYLDVPNAQDVIEENEYVRRNWMDEKVVEGCDSITHGAGQIRPYGRLALMNHFSSLKDVIKSKVKDMHDYTTITDENFQVTSAEVNVCFVYSVAGGTGAGIWLDLAYLVKEAFSELGVKTNTKAFVILPEIFDAIIDWKMEKSNIFGNSYGCLRELEFFMNSKKRKEYTAKYGEEMILSDNLETKVKRSYKIKDAPFDIVQLITNESHHPERGMTTYDKKEHLMEVIGNTIVLKTGKYSAKSNSSWDNIRRLLARMAKEQSSSGLIARNISIGYAEINYNFNLIEEYAVNELGSKLVSRMIDNNNSDKISSEKLKNKILNEWRINEHNHSNPTEDNQVLDQMLGKMAKEKKLVNIYTASKHKGWKLAKELEKVKSHLKDPKTGAYAISEDQATKNLDAFKKEKIKAISDFFIGKGGILDTSGVEPTLTGINRLLNEGMYSVKVFKQEMLNEIQANNTEKGSSKYLEMKRQTRVKNEEILQKQASDNGIGTWFSDSHITRALTLLGKSINEEVEANYEYLKRSKATEFYKALENELNEIRKNLEDFKTELETSASLFTEKMLKYRRSEETYKSRPFSLELAMDYLDHLTTANTDNYDSGLSSFLGSKKLYKFVDLRASVNNQLETGGESDSLISVITKQMKTTPSYKKLKDANVTSILTEFHGRENDGPEKVLKKYDQLALMANPLTNLDTRDAQNKVKLWMESILWGIPKEGKIFERDTNKKESNMVTGNNNFISCSTVFFPARIDLYPNIKRYWDAYDALNREISCDLDKRITSEMNSSRFHLLPNINSEEKSMFAWCFGFIMYVKTDGKKGIFKKRGNTYKIISRLGDPSNNSEFDLGNHYRYKAFDNFRSNAALLSETIKDASKWYHSLSDDDKEQLLISLRKAKDEHYSKFYRQNYAQPGKIIGGSTDERQQKDKNLLDDETRLMSNIDDSILADYFKE